nr:aspartic proteinase CDR1-like [Quercus suber]
MDEQDDIHTAYAKLYKVLEKHEKLYRLTTKKFSDAELEREELSTKFDESNQTIGTQMPFMIDGDYTKGILSSDMFTFPVRDGVVAHFANVIFGVGLENAKRPFMLNNNLIEGTLGLGRGPRSILRQLKDATHLRFSYCLFDFSSGDDTYTYLHFGEDAKIIGNDQEMVKSTQLLPEQNKYYLQVLGITMNEDLLPINPKEYQLRGNSNGGFIIDSGTGITQLVPNAYNVVRIEIVRYLKKAYNWNPLVNSGIYSP